MSFSYPKNIDIVNNLEVVETEEDLKERVKRLETILFNLIGNVNNDNE